MGKMGAKVHGDMRLFSYRQLILAIPLLYRFDVTMIDWKNRFASFLSFIHRFK